MSTASQIEAQPYESALYGVTGRIIFCIFILTSAVSVLGISVVVLTGTLAGVHDFTSYWAAGQQLIRGANPYSESAVSVLERSHGYKGTDMILIMRNPPSALFLVIPLGLVGAQTGSILWSLLSLGCLAASIRMIWRMNGSPPGRLHLLGYLFVPVLLCFATGQIGIILLLGLALFLRLHDSKPWLAGMALSLCALKPHLFLPFAVALFVWIVTRKAYRILVGAALALGVCCVIPLFFDPSVWTQYIQMARKSGIENEFMVDLGTLLRFALDRQAIWLQFLPAALACVWALWYFQRHRMDWDWQTHGSLLMIVSVLAAPYSWFTDQAVLMPALLHGLYSGKSQVALLGLTSVALFEMLFSGVNQHSVPLFWAYCWPAIAWLAWYLWPMGSGLGSTSLPKEIEP